MTDQPTNPSTNGPTNGPTKPPANPPASQAGEGSPPTQPMSAAKSGAPVGPPTASLPVTPVVAEAPKRNLWHRATSSNRGRWGVAIGAGVLACLLLFGIGVAALSVAGHNDRISLAGDRKGANFPGQGGPGNGQGLGGAKDKNDKKDQQDQQEQQNPQDQQDQPDQQGMPNGMPGGRMAGPGGLGALAGTALHGDVTASANGSVQALVFQRGEVTAVSATSITIKSSDGFTGTYKLTSATTSKGDAAVKGGQAFVLAKASDKVALEMKTGPVKAAVAPSN